MSDVVKLVGILFDIALQVLAALCLLRYLGWF
jgi:hypothetical protein